MICLGCGKPNEGQYCESCDARDFGGEPGVCAHGEVADDCGACSMGNAIDAYDAGAFDD